MLHRRSVLRVCALFACALVVVAAPVRAGSDTAAPPAPPAAAKAPKDVSMHGEKRVDDYFWLREKENPAVIEHLKAENAYMEASLAHTEGLQKRLYDEILGRIQETDLSAPVREDGWLYYSRTEQGKAYPIFCRRAAGQKDAPEHVLLDVNLLAEGKEYMALGAYDVSPDHRVLAYSTDDNGSEKYTMVFKDLSTGELSSDSIPGTSYSTAWGNDNRTFFYVKQDAAQRPHQLWRHTLGTPASDDALVYEEKDERFFLSVGKTRSEEYLVLSLGSMSTSEARLLDADTPTGEFGVVLAREQGVEYEVEHQGDRLYVVTNKDATNFKLLSSKIPAAGGAWAWEEVLAHRDDVTLTGVDGFKDHLVIHERAQGLPTMRVRRVSTGAEHTVEMPESVYVAGPTGNAEYDTTALRFNYTSLVTPSSIYDYDMNTKQRTLLKEQPVLGGYDRTKYTTRRIWAVTEDGTRVPISLVHRRDTALDGSAPCLLYGYGSYGANSEPGFSSARLSLLDRGFVYAIAHTRGGSEMGRSWYESGRLMHKMNTFTDFIACAEKLVADGYTKSDRLAILGGSAGGLLVGAVVNMRPELFKAAVAAVPFVDVINTMVDPTIPLTVTEWEQWGDPRKPEDYGYIRQYSPYDNVGAKPYPAMLVLAGLNDPRVAYWEPAKWVAKLRAMKTGDAPILLKTNLDGGHSGPSGRYEGIKEQALQFAFILDQLGAAGPATGAAPSAAPK